MYAGPFDPLQPNHKVLGQKLGSSPVFLDLYPPLSSGDEKQATRVFAYEEKVVIKSNQSNKQTINLLLLKYQHISRKNQRMSDG